jgi:uncharacterized SAM-binding protein YcdF (DUF218 family)
MKRHLQAKFGFLTSNSILIILIMLLIIFIIVQIQNWPSLYVIIMKKYHFESTKFPVNASIEISIFKSIWIFSMCFLNEK